MIELTLREARVIGSLIEKEITTPDQYPLSLKGLTTACNQKSNREPVMALEETEVQELVDTLRGKNLVSEVLFGSRVAKYKHRFCNTEFSKLHLNPQELGVICVLFLRGPQTPGELRSKTNRLCEFKDIIDIDACLHRLATREDGPFVAKLDRVPGKRESRYAQLFTGPPTTLPANEPRGAEIYVESVDDRVSSLELEVAHLKRELEELKRQWQEFIE